VTQQDIDRGLNIVNTVSVSSTLTPTPVQASAITLLTQTALLRITKTADKSTVTSVGEQIAYTIVVRNAVRTGKKKKKKGLKKKKKKN
jgi:hypothetical protein